MLDGNEEAFHVALDSLSELANRVQVTLIPVYTNLYHLDDDDVLAFEAVFGASLAAIAHIFSKRVSKGLIPSSDHVLSGMSPMGSHPLLDPNYGSADVSIAHEDTWMTRLDKVRLLTQWDDCLPYIRTCADFFRPAQNINCGQCEKCLRTMIELLVCGSLTRCTTFPPDVTPEMLEALEVSLSWEGDRKEFLKRALQCITDVNAKCWYELLQPLREMGRQDLVAVLERKLEDQQKWTPPRQRWKERIQDFDRSYLGGSLLKGANLLKGQR